MRQNPYNSENAPTENASVSHIVGVGLDNTDGHKRMTSSEKFSIVGGSEETHERMTETLVKTFEEMKQKGLNLEEMEQKELGDILAKNTPS